MLLIFSLPVDKRTCLSRVWHKIKEMLVNIVFLVELT